MSTFSLEKDIYDQLFSLAEYSDDKEGIVCAAVVDREGTILASSPSLGDGRHAEYAVLEKMKNQNIQIKPSYVMYITLEPCSMRTNPNFKDCTTLLIESGIKHIYFAALDPEYSQGSRKKLIEAGIEYTQIHDEKIIKKSRDLFNSTNFKSYKI